MVDHFLLHKLSCTSYVQKRRILRHGQEVRSRVDYILVMERCLFQNVAIRYTRHNTNHYMVLG